MSDTPIEPQQQRDTTADPDGENGSEGTVRQHPQAPAEGPDEATEQRPDVPRVHSDDPAEG